MRTRLDEIVEEELCRKGKGLCFCSECQNGKRIAERAFRHGVEQMALRVREGVKPGYLYYGPVRPAPAGDRCAGKTGIHVCPDRRKGERRKGFEARGNYNPQDGGFIKAIYMPPFGGIDKSPWRPDRRSGKDRRKP